MYSNAKYTKNFMTKEVDSIYVEINGAPAFVPIDEENKDYQNIMQLVADGKLVIQPAE